MPINSDVTTQGYNFDPSLFTAFEKALSAQEDADGQIVTGGTQKKQVVQTEGHAVKPVGVSDTQDSDASQAASSAASIGVTVDAQGNKVAVVSVGMQDILEQASTEIDKFSSAYVSVNNRNLIVNSQSDSPALVLTTSTGTLPSGSAGKSNPFLTASFMVALVEVMAELIKVQSEQRQVETKLDIMSNQWTIDLAKRAASDILEAAKTEAQMHYMLAASAGVQLGMAVANGAMGAIAMKKAIGDHNAQTKILQNKYNDLNEPVKSNTANGKAGTDQEISDALFKLNEHKANKWSNISTQFRMRMFAMDTAKDVTDASAKMYENVVQGMMKVKKAEYDADLKMLEAYQEISRKIGSDASASLKDIEDKVKSIADLVSQILDKNYQAFNYRIH
ncbi:hypothetical protein [Parachlamydia sp. AcF125]|uniref:hypothetical protein n=1 Tax=Parachlamydia sp. AcF125 TaxID=2795736 RepID=UPI001BC9FE57|nr:hypothetical protein [Parachlamydia sp. AcF125]MBS4168098.1 hypothetical protein [Parachlamydia sp. AcF125]